MIVRAIAAYVGELLGSLFDLARLVLAALVRLPPLLWRTLVRWWSVLRTPSLNERARTELEAEAAESEQFFGFLRRMTDYLRVPLLVLALGVVVFFGVEQGRDITMALVEEGRGLERLFFVFAVIVLASSMWFESRRLLYDRREYLRKRRSTSHPPSGAGPASVELRAWELAFIRRAPRLMGVAVAWLAAGAVALGGTWDHWLFAISLVGLGVALYVSFHVRQRLPFVTWSAEDVDRARAVRWLFRAFGAIALVLGLASFHVDLGAQWAGGLGSAAVVFLSLSALNLGLSRLVYRTRELGFPVIRLLAAMYLLTTGIIWLAGDHHGIRTHPRAVAPALDERPTLAEAHRAWSSRACGRAPGTTMQQTASSTVGRAQPLVLVAAAGGGLRAAYYTTRVLTALEGLVPSFRSQVFAVSGVSGGAVGATLWAAWAPTPVEPRSAEAQRQRCGRVGSSDATWDELASFFDDDYLAPLTAGMMLPDLTKRFLPIPFLRSRAEYLERAWENGFDRVATAAGRRLGGFAAPFWTLRPPSCAEAEAPWRPILVLNSTHQQLGVPVLTTPLAPDPTIFPGSIDFYATHVGQAVPISAAAHNAARFPVFSPSGTLRDGSGHLLDGGYLENNGADTVRQMISALARIDEVATRARLIVIQITNDDGLPVDYARDDFAHRPETRRGVWNDPWGPVQGILATSNGRAFGAGAALANTVRHDADRRFTEGAAYFHFRLFRDEEEPAAPLGWVLSRRARAGMDQQLWCHPQHRDQLAGIVRELTGETVPDGWSDRCVRERGGREGR